MSPMEATVDPLSRGSRLDADHPENGVLIPCRFTALKRQMVAETQAPGASVSIVARRHDVNSNQLFRWRRQLLPKAVVESGAMVPVEIAPDDGRSDGGRPRRADREGVIEIAFGCGARVRLRGEVSPETLRQVIELLR